MELAIHGLAHPSSEKLTISDQTFGQEFKSGLVHQVVTAYMAAGRAGTKAQKTRREVRGGGIKPWKQKGTGRARAGTIRSPLWRGGGVTFAADNRDYTQKVNKKMYRSAMISIFSELVRQDRLVVVDSLSLEQPKTRLLKELLAKLGLEKTLILVDGDDRNLSLAARNVFTIQVNDASRVDPVSLVSAEKVLVTVDAVKKIEERLA